MARVLLAATSIFALLGLAATGHAAELPTPAGEIGTRARGEARPALEEYLRGVPGDLEAGAAAIVSQDVLPFALAGVVATGAAFTVDDKVRSWFRGHDRLGGTSSAGDVLGLGTTHLAVTAGLLTIGQLAGSRRETEAGVTLAEALAANELVTWSLKALTRRKRPGRTSRDSFPSGHASGTAALSGSLAAAYEWRPAVTVPLVLLTAFVGASRLQADAHWCSDVAAGIVVGGLIGAAIGNGRRERPRRWALLPFAWEGRGGLLLARRF